MAKPDAVRLEAFRILKRFEKAPGHTNVTRLKADSLIQQHADKAWSAQDRAFLTALVYGVLRQWTVLNHQLQVLSGRDLKKIPADSRTLIKLGFFQLQFLSHVPDYAAINTTVDLAKYLKLSAPSVKFVNALLRACQRKLAEDGFTIPSLETDPIAHLSLTYSLPPWWVKRLLRQFTHTEVLAMAQAYQHPAVLTVRVNTLKMPVADYQQQLSGEGIRYESPDPELPEVLALPEFQGTPRLLPGYEAGWFYVQDPSSAWVSHELAPQPGETVLDLCAAPGSKTTHMAALMENRGSITAIDPKPERVALLKENLARLGVENVQVVQADALQYQTEELFDKVLVDAPCSGLGTIRRHSEILAQLREGELKQYPARQLALLEKGLSFLKPGGVLVYSTCSLDRDENHAVAAQGLIKYPDVTLAAEEQRPLTSQADGFYLARLVHRGI